MRHAKNKKERIRDLEKQVELLWAALLRTPRFDGFADSVTIESNKLGIKPRLADGKIFEN